MPASLSHAACPHTSPVANSQLGCDLVSRSYRARAYSNSHLSDTAGDYGVAHRRHHGASGNCHRAAGFTHAAIGAEAYGRAPDACSFTNPGCVAHALRVHLVCVETAGGVPR